MRVSRAEAEANHQRVIDEASRLFRERGYDGIGLKSLMNAAGLTQGGFYKQFESKDDLIAQATARALEQSSARRSEIVETNPDSPFEALVDRYLSPAHRDSRDRGCALAALGADVPRHAPDLRKEFETGIRDFLEILDQAMGNRDGEVPTSSALAALSTMVGALVLARTTESESLSVSILEAAAQHLKQLSPHERGDGDEQAQ